MSYRKKLATVARREALKSFHGYVMGTEPNIQPIIKLFPEWPLTNWDGKWCAAFVYYCCIMAGLDIPMRYPHEAVSCNFAGCVAWEEWARLPCHEYFHEARADDGFIPDAGDIVLYNNVFCDEPHDHIGIILKNNETSLTVAEGNFNNVSSIVERIKDSHIRAYIRIPEYRFSES